MFLIHMLVCDCDVVYIEMIRLIYVSDTLYNDFTMLVMMHHTLAFRSKQASQAYQTALCLSTSRSQFIAESDNVGQ